MQRLAVLFASVVAFAASPIQAQTNIESDAGVVTMNATVQAVDVENKTIDVVGPLGNVVQIKAPPEVIGTIKINEKITVSYSDEVAMALRKLQGPPANAANSENSITADEEGGMNMNAPTEAEQNFEQATPTGAAELDLVEITAPVVKIDYANRIVTLKGPQGQLRVIKVDASVPGLDAIKPGDTVVTEVTRAVAVNVKPL
jgi:Cu/Ag efflux protein CusF